MRIENSFIPASGVGTTTERRLWEAGVTHWDEFDRSLVGSTTAERIEAWIAEADDRLVAGDADYFDRAFPSQSRWRLYENFREDVCFLDIETTGLDHDGDEVTVVSLTQGGETTTLVQGRDLSAVRLEEHLSDARLLATFNGKRFDVPFLEASFDLAIDLPHLDLMYPCRRLDLTGGLKPIEKELGIDRDRPDLSGRDAVRLWNQYERGDTDALDTLVSYNRDDTENLAALADEVVSRLHRDLTADIETEASFSLTS
jgi:uncharacterized protein YprB with RNaseH-like and TPR domain